MQVVHLYPVAANEDSFWPAEFQDDAFISWLHKATLRIANLPAGASENRTRQILLAEGMPCPAWISALMFIMKLVRSNTKGGAA